MRQLARPTPQAGRRSRAAHHSWRQRRQPGCCVSCTWLCGCVGFDSAAAVHQRASAAAGRAKEGGWVIGTGSGTPEAKACEWLQPMFGSKGICCSHSCCCTCTPLETFQKSEKAGNEKVAEQQQEQQAHTGGMRTSTGAARCLVGCPHTRLTSDKLTETAAQLQQHRS